MRKVRCFFGFHDFIFVGEKRIKKSVRASLCNKIKRLRYNIFRCTDCGKEELELFDERFV